MEEDLQDVMVPGFAGFFRSFLLHQLTSPAPNAKPANSSFCFLCPYHHDPATLDSAGNAVLLLGFSVFLPSNIKDLIPLLFFLLLRVIHSSTLKQLCRVCRSQSSWILLRWTTMVGTSIPGCTRHCSGVQNHHCSRKRSPGGR